TTDANGDATIHQNGIGEFYRRNPDGSYEGHHGDFSTLTLAGGTYQLRGADGTVQAFRVDGKIDYVEDLNGNRVTAGYDARGRLTDQHRDSVAGVPQEAVAFAYGAGASYTRTDADGGRTETLFDADGQPRRVIDPNGGVTERVYGEDDLLRKLVLPDG